MLGMTEAIERQGSQSTFGQEIDLLSPTGFALNCFQAASVTTLLACGNDLNRVLSRIGFLSGKSSRAVKEIGGPFMPRILGGAKMQALSRFSSKWVPTRNPSMWQGCCR